MSNEITVDQMNEAIALFMNMRLEETYPSGYIEHEWVPSFAHSNWCFKEPPPFDRSWGWLMPVWFKIQTIGADMGYSFKKFHEAFHAGIDNQSIEKCHDAVYQFITWLNQQTNTDGTK